MRRQMKGNAFVGLLTPIAVATLIGTAIVKPEAYVGAAMKVRQEAIEAYRFAQQLTQIPTLSSRQTGTSYIESQNNRVYLDSNNQIAVQEKR